MWSAVLPRAQAEGGPAHACAAMYLPRDPGATVAGKGHPPHGGSYGGPNHSPLAESGLASLLPAGRAFPGTAEKEVGRIAFQSTLDMWGRGEGSSLYCPLVIGSRCQPGQLCLGGNATPPKREGALPEDWPESPSESMSPPPPSCCGMGQARRPLALTLSLASLCALCQAPARYLPPFLHIFLLGFRAHSLEIRFTVK